jgi:hypothetical protein
VPLKGGAKTPADYTDFQLLAGGPLSARTTRLRGIHEFRCGDQTGRPADTLEEFSPCKRISIIHRKLLPIV